MKKRCTEKPIIGFLKEVGAAAPVKGLRRRPGFPEASCYACGVTSDGMDVSDTKRQKALGAENTCLKLVRYMRLRTD